MEKTIPFFGQMEKKTLIRPILQRSKHVSQMCGGNPFTWKEIKQALEDENIVLQDDDIITVGYTEGWQEGDSARDAAYDLRIDRPRLETDVEFEKRKKRAEEAKVSNKELRLKSYEKLKAEFEPDAISAEDIVNTLTKFYTLAAPMEYIRNHIVESIRDYKKHYKNKPETE